MRRLSRALLTVLCVLFSIGAYADNYKIGVLVPLTGPAAEKGIPLKNAAELFVDKFNAASGSDGNTLELVVRDDADDPEKARAAAAELVKDESLLAVIGHYYPEVVLATGKIFADAKIPFLTPNVSNPAALADNPWAFTLNVPDDVQGSFLAVYIKEVLKKDNVLLIYNTDPFGSALHDAFIQKASRIGLHVLKTLPLQKGAVPKDWVATHLPDKAENARFGIVAALTHSESGLSFLPQLRDHGINTPVMAPNTWATPKFFSELTQKDTDNVYVTSTFLWEIANQQATDFALAYAKKYGGRPPVAATMSYDAMLLLSKAINGGTTGENEEAPGENAVTEGKTKAPATRATIRHYLASIDWLGQISGATGTLYFNTAKDNTAEYVAQYLAKTAVPAQPPQPQNTAAPIRPQGQKGDTGKAGKPQAQPAATLAVVAQSAVSSEGLPAKQQPAESASQPPLHASNVQAIPRDLFVSRMANGRFKLAEVQLTRPREEYVLKELEERIAKGQIALVDGVPYHLVDVVFVGVDVIRINDINLKDMVWDTDVFMWLKWGGPRLDPKDLEKITAINAVKEQSSLFKEDLTGKTKYRAYRKRLTLGSPFDLSAFPFDSQTLRLEIAHTNKNATHIMLVPDSRHMETAPIRDIKPQEWTYTGRDIFSNLYRYESTFGDPDYRLGKGYKSPIDFSTFNFEVGVKRMLLPYAFTFFLPLAIILGIILLILWVPIDQFAPRINAAISGLVGVLVYHMSQKNTFPKVGYTMFADYYFLIAYAFVVAMIICIIVTQTMVSNGNKEKAKIWNRRFSIGAMITAIIIFVGMTLFGMWRHTT